MSISIALCGASGYAGGEVLRLLLSDGDFEIGALTAGSSAGKTLGQFHPHLPALADREILPTEAQLLADHDIVVFALPHGQSGRLTAQLAQLGSRALIVDCGADHRLQSAEAWEDYYGGQFQEAWPYSMPELLHAGESVAIAQRAILAKAGQIAVPGCNVTAVTLALQPAIAAGLVDPSTISSSLVVGYSGAGKALKPNLLAAEGIGGAQPYSVAGTHRHIPEVVQNFQVTGAIDPKVSLTPVLAPMSRGILATVTAACQADDDQVRKAYEQAYGNEAVIDFCAPGRWPTTAEVLGSGRAVVGAQIDHKSGQLVALCAIDNLGKGTASAALQGLNLAWGRPETAGVPRQGVAP